MKYFKILSNYHYILTALKSFSSSHSPKLTFWITTLNYQYKIIVIFLQYIKLAIKGTIRVPLAAWQGINISQVAARESNHVSISLTWSSKKNLTTIL